MSVRKFHYTVSAYLGSILESRAIKPATAFTPIKRHRAVWLSSNPVWEQTANKLVRSDGGKIRKLDMAGTAEIGGGLVRIEVDPKAAPYSFRDYIRRAKVSKKIEAALISAAVGMGADPAEWYVRFTAVKIEDWLDVEVFNWPAVVWESLNQLIENKESVLGYTK
jgi:hypothetical protein